MAPFGSMGFAADGGVEMGGVVSSDGGRGTLQIQNRMGDMAPSGDFTLCVWSLFLIFGRFGSFCVFSCLHMEWDFAQVSAHWNPEF